MKEIIKEKYRKELEEMSNSELLFEFEFSCNEIERLSRIINNGPYEQQLLSYEMVRKRICKEKGREEVHRETALEMLKDGEKLSKIMKYSTLAQEAIFALAKENGLEVIA